MVKVILFKIVTFIIYINCLYSIFYIKISSILIFIGVTFSYADQLHH